MQTIQGAHFKYKTSTKMKKDYFNPKKVGVIILISKYIAEKKY